MLSRFRYILLFSIVLFSSIKAAAQISMPDNVYVGTVKHYWVDSIIGSGSTYTWKIDHVIQQNGPVNLFSITWNIAGAYFLEVQKTSANNCPSEVKSGWVYVIAAPVLGIITIKENVLYIGGNTGSITVVGSGGIPPYVYKLGAGAYQPSGTFNSLKAGIYNVTIRDATLSTFILTITITQPSLLTASTTHTNIQCPGDATGSATAIATGGTEPYSYSWNTSPVQTSATVSGLAAGIYTVTVTDRYGFSVAATPVSIVFENPLPTAAFTSSQSVLNTHSFVNTSANATSYAWDFGDGQASTIANPIHVFATAGTYTVKLTVANSCGADIETQVITVPELEFFNGFSPNGDGQNDNWNIPVLNYYPVNRVLVINRWGSEIWKGINYNNNDIVWTGKNKNGEDMPDGTYYYIINYNNTEKRGWVFIKR